MNSDIIVGRWKQLKGGYGRRGPNGPAAIARLAGSNDFLAGVLQEDYGRERDAVSSEKTSH